MRFVLTFFDSFFSFTILIIHKTKLSLLLLLLFLLLLLLLLLHLFLPLFFLNRFESQNSLGSGPNWYFKSSLLKLLRRSQ
jgi:uncharacterized protein (DUF58 family)